MFLVVLKLKMVAPKLCCVFTMWSNCGGELQPGGVRAGHCRLNVYIQNFALGVIMAIYEYFISV